MNGLLAKCLSSESFLLLIVTKEITAYCLRSQKTREWRSHAVNVTLHFLMALTASSRHRLGYARSWCSAVVLLPNILLHTMSAECLS